MGHPCERSRQTPSPGRHQCRYELPALCDSVIFDVVTHRAERDASGVYVNVRILCDEEPDGGRDLTVDMCRARQWTEDSAPRGSRAKDVFCDFRRWGGAWQCARELLLRIGRP